MRYTELVFLKDRILRPISGLFVRACVRACVYVCVCVRACVCVCVCMCVRVFEGFVENPDEHFRSFHDLSFRCKLFTVSEISANVVALVIDGIKKTTFPL